MPGTRIGGYMEEFLPVPYIVTINSSTTILIETRVVVRLVYNTYYYSRILPYYIVHNSVSTTAVVPSMVHSEFHDLYCDSCTGVPYVLRDLDSACVPH